jgi:AmmeMemoRadiSam system protein A
MAGELTDRERRTLLVLARSAIESELAGADGPSPDMLTDALESMCGAFVTLTTDGELRGCIGHVNAIQPLWQSVRDNAIAAAMRDPRFPAVSSGELAGIEIEISALSPLHEVRDPDEIVVGRDGLLIECRDGRGLLLPQVAARYGWDRETFLDNTCRKAGLRPGCWRSPDALVHRFTVDSFAEAELLETD